MGISNVNKTHIAVELQGIQGQEAYQGCEDGVNSSLHRWGGSGEQGPAGS